MGERQSAVQIELSGQVLLRERKRKGKRPAAGDRRGGREERNEVIIIAKIKEIIEK